MKKKRISALAIITLVIVIIILILFIFKPNSSQVCIKENCFNVELAKTQAELTKGLMYRSSLESTSGMLFIFQTEGKYSFWMKNTLVPLDILWINKNKEIIYINKDTLPCQSDPCLTYGPNSPALYVLEINAGLSEKYSFNVGDKVDFDY